MKNNNPYNYISKYLDSINKKENNDFMIQNNQITNLDNDSNNFESNDILSVILNKFEIYKKDNSVSKGRSDRYISLTNVYTCPRNMFFQRHKYSIDEKKAIKYPHTVLINKVGEYIHEFIAELLNIESTTKLYLQTDKFKVRGKCDGIIDNKIIEIKTVENLPNNFDKLHFLQLMLLTYLAIKQKYDIKTSYLLYIRRNLKEFKEFKFPIHNFEELEKFVLPFLEKAKLLHDNIRHKQLPEYIKLGDCFFCLYEHHCDKKGISFDMFLNFNEVEIANLISSNKEIADKEEKDVKSINKEEQEMLSILFEDNNDNIINNSEINVNNQQNKEEKSIEQTINNDILDWL